MSKNHKNLTLPFYQPSPPPGIQLVGPFDESHVQLRLGGGKASTWDKLKPLIRALAAATFGVFLFYATLSVWTHTSLGRLGGTPSFPTMLIATTSDVGAESHLHTSLKEYPLDLSRDVHLDVIGGETRIVFSRTVVAPVQGGIVLETTWKHEESNATFQSTDIETRLTVKGSDSTLHTVHVGMPSNTTFFPKLFIHASRLSFELEARASTTTFGSLVIDTDELLHSPPYLEVQDDLEITAIEADIRGIFTFSRRLALRVKTGSIDVGVHILDPDPHRVDPTTPPPTLDARTNAGSVTIEVLSQAHDVESRITGMTGMGVVDISQILDFEGGFEADIDQGMMKVTTEKPKVLYVTEEDRKHVKGYIRVQPDIQVVSHHTTSTTMPSVLHCPPHCPPEQVKDGVEHTFGLPYATDTGSPRPEPSTVVGDRSVSIQTDPPYPRPSITTQLEDMFTARQFAAGILQADQAVLEAYSHASSSTSTTWQDPRAPMPTVRPVPPPPMRHKWGKHCPPICPPGYAGDAGDDQETALASSNPTGVIGAGSGDLDATATVTPAPSEGEAKQHHTSGSWPDHCEPPFCFFRSVAAGSAGDEREKRLPKGGLVKASAHVGSIKLKL